MAKLYLDLLLLLIYRRLDWLAVPLAPGSTSLDIGIRTSFSARPWMFRRLLIGCTVIGAAWLPLERHRVLSSLVFQIVSVFPYCARKPLRYFNIIDYVVLWLFLVSAFALLRFHPRGAVTVLLFDDLLL